jgi:succinate dehydrogenase/fumarate reductase-like Fe-S protein
MNENKIIENPLHVIKEEESNEDQSKLEDNPICISCLLCYFICLPLFSLFR